MKLMEKAVPQTNMGSKEAEINIWRIHSLPPSRENKPPPKKPFTGAVTAYMNIVVLSREPRLGDGGGVVVIGGC